jgi:hypothetical protein
MAETHGRYGYNSETATSTSAIGEILDESLTALQLQIDALSGGGDPLVISELQDSVDALETAQADLAADVAGKADAAVVTAALNLKASVTALNDGLAAKADASTVTALAGTVTSLSTALSGKASTAYVDSGLATKASASSVADLTTTVNSKADASTVTSLASTVAAKANTSYVDTVAGDVDAVETALAGKVNAVAALLGLNPLQTFFKLTRNGDATATDGWVNMIEVWYDPNGAPGPRLVAWFNEYGEFRLIPGNSNTVPLRVYAKDLIADAAHTGMLLDIVDHREGTRTTIAGFDSAGNVIAQNHVEIQVGGSQPANGSGILWADTSGV